MVNTHIASLTEITPQEQDHLFELMRHAYEITEVEIWGEGYTRMPKEEFLELFEKQEIIVAELDGELVGSIHVYPLSETVYAFGLLSADFAHKGKGIGRALIQAAEEKATAEGAQLMSLEILRPELLDVPFKRVLKDWYERLGYQFVKSERFEARKPNKAEKAKRLIRPCLFDVYEKPLQ